MTNPVRLSWAQVTPALAANLDVDAMTRLALAQVPETRPRGVDEQAIEHAIDAAFIGAHGSWASGWRWAHGEGSIGGGPVSKWCCTTHSIWRKEDRDPMPTARRAAEALVEWRSWIVRLAELFGRSEAGLPAIVAFERSAAAVLAAVVAQTNAEDAWYAHAHQVLLWFLESHGHDNAERVITRAIDGRFESWVTPSDDLAQDVVAGLRDRIFRTRHDHVDGIALWHEARAATAWLALPQGRASADGVLDYIFRHDVAIDEARGDRMLAALEAARASARGSEPMSFTMLQAWQRDVLGADVTLRKHDAWAKDGRERYACEHDLEARLEAALAEANDLRVSAVARAARIYLDVCFFHPFVDGNARAARLALDFVLTRAGLAVNDPDGALFRIPLAVTDPEVGAHYQALLARLVC